MRAGLIERGVPAEAIYRDPTGYRTWDSVLRARDVYGQKRMLIVSQRFHRQPRAVHRPPRGHRCLGVRCARCRYALQHPHRAAPYPSALRAYYDVWTNAGATRRGKKVAIGVDPPE